MSFSKIDNLCLCLFVFQMAIISSASHGMDHKRSALESGKEPPCKKQHVERTQPNPRDLVLQTPCLVQHIASFLRTRDFGRLRQANQQIHRITHELALARLAQIFIQDYHDPIRETLRLSQGNDRISLYGQLVNTGRFIRELLSAGAQLTRLGNYEKKHIYFKGEELYILDRPKFVRDNPEALKGLLGRHKINAFSALDLLPWHEAPVNPTAQQVFEIAQQFPGEGIVITITEGNVTQGWVEELVKLGAAPLVVSLNIDASFVVNFPDGLECLAHLQNLRELFLCTYSSEGKYFPSQLCALRELRTFVIVPSEFNVAIEIPSDIVNLKNLQCLQLVKAGSLNIPQKIGQLTMLRCLILQTSGALFVPRDIGNLKNLRVLHLMTKAPEGLTVDEPEALGKLENLRVLLIEDPAIRWNTGALANLKNLHFLHLGDSDNSYCPKIPESIINLKNMRWFRADIDKDSQIPATVIDWIATEIGSNTYFGNANQVTNPKSHVFRDYCGKDICMEDCQLIEALRSLNKQGVFGAKARYWFLRLSDMVGKHGQDTYHISCLKNKWRLLFEKMFEVSLLNKETFSGKELADLISLLPKFQQYLMQYKATLKKTLDLFHEHLPEEWDLINAVINKVF